MKHVFAYMAVTAMLFTACNSGENKQALTNDPALNAEKTEDQAKAPSGDGIAGKQSPDHIKTARFTPPQINHEDWDKKIIKTAEITLELQDYASYNQQLHAGLKAYGAYIAGEEQTSSPDRMANEVTVKVPVDQFDNLLNSFSGEGITVLQKKIGSEDVTEEMVDTKSRIEARKRVRDRYLALLQQARNMKEILEVQQEINSIQEDIESASGRVGYLSHQSAYSTIHLHYFQYLNGNTPPETSGFLVQLKEGFSGGIRSLGTVVLLLVSIWPLLLAVLLVVLWLRRAKHTGSRAAR